LKQGFAYDNRGNLLTLTDILQPTRNKSFTCDKLGRIVTLNGAWGAGSFTYATCGLTHCLL